MTQPPAPPPGGLGILFPEPKAEPAPAVSAPKVAAVAPEPVKAAPPPAPVAKPAEAAPEKPAPKKLVAAAEKKPPQKKAGRGGKLELAVTPWGEVLVDGKSRGISPPLRELEILPGSHTIEIRNSTFPAHVRIRHRFK
jgi:hypothetical protein